MELSTNTVDIELSNEESEEKRQAARAFLRERFLKVMSMEVGSLCEMTTIEGNQISGKYEGTNYITSHFLVKNLQTPIASIPDALVRASDILYLNFPTPKSVERI